MRKKLAIVLTVSVSLIICISCGEESKKASSNGTKELNVKVPDDLTIEWETGWSDSVAPEEMKAEFVRLKPTTDAEGKKCFELANGRLVWDWEAEDGRKPEIANTKHIYHEQCKDIVQELINIKIFELNDAYAAMVEGGSKEIIYVRMDGKEKRITFYAVEAVQIKTLLAKLKGLIES